MTDIVHVFGSGPIDPRALRPVPTTRDPAVALAYLRATGGDGTSEHEREAESVAADRSRLRLSFGGDYEEQERRAERWRERKRIGGFA